MNTKNKSKHPWRRRARPRPQRLIEWQCDTSCLDCTDDTTFAAIDLGTNNCRLLIAKLTAQGLEIVDSWSRITRLGEGLVQTGQLDPAAMRRTVTALETCARRMEKFGVTAYRAVATEACRRAGNGAEFAARVNRETGLNLDIIDCTAEAAYAVRGCDSLVCPEQNQAVIFDIGGGSSELTLINRQGDSFSIDSVISLPLGVVTMFESHYRPGGDVAMMTAIREDVSRHLENWSCVSDLAGPAQSGKVQLIGTSGTITTMAALYLELPRYQRLKVDGQVVQVDGLKKISAELMTMNLDDRAAHPCIGEGRADLVLPGAAIVDAIIDALPAPEITVADRGIREGILIELADRRLRAGKNKSKPA